MSEPEMIPVTPPRRGRSCFVGCTTLIGLVIALVVGLYLYARYQADRHLRETIAAIEVKDPRWRLADIEEDRPEIPEAENSAVVLLTVRAMLPAGFPPVDLVVPGENVEPPHRLREKTAADLKKELEKYPEAIAKARTLAELDRGRYPIAYTPDFVSTLLPHAQQVREVAYLLNFDAAHLAEQGDVNGALRSSRAGLAAARSIGDEPLLISLLVRLACVGVASNSAVRAINQGEASDAELAAVIAFWQKEDRENLLLQAMRGERAGIHEAATQLQNGKLTLAQLGGGGGSPYVDRLMLLGRSTWLKHEHAALLKMMTQYVEAAELPLHEQMDQMDALEQQLKGSPGGLMQMLLPAMTKVAQAAQRNQATVRNLMVVAAAERYRKANGKWPGSITDLVPAYLPEVPLDPYDGQPIRLRRTEYGLVVYCLGPDRKDDQGHVTPKILLTPGSDWGYRLWDVDKRRQPAPPLPPPEEEDPFGPPGGRGAVPPMPGQP